jgi:hypothetical protein
MGIATEPPEAWREWTGAAFEHTARILCEPCNNGLSELETKMGFLFDRLVGDEGTWIEPASQELLAHWLYKTGLMVSTTMDREAASLARHHYTELAGTLDLPPASFVWVGQLENPVHDATLRVQRFDWWDKQAVPARLCEGFAFALGIRLLVGFVVVFDLRQSPESDDWNPIRTGSPVQEKLVRAWPASAHYGLKWPPPAKLNIDDLESIWRAIAQLKPEDS